MFFNKVLNEMGHKIDFKNFQDLRNTMFDQHPNLEKINKINLEKNLKPKSINAKFSKNNILSNITNFYMTDSVSRNSPTMSSCSIELNENRQN